VHDRELLLVRNKLVNTVVGDPHHILSRCKKRGHPHVYPSIHARSRTVHTTLRGSLDRKE